LAYDPGEEEPVRIRKSFRHKAETAKGRAKKAVGRASGNRRLKVQGRTDQAVGGLKQAGDKIRSAFRH
jgi:uncharacterized protein YjbJ (UPF0337 family)